MCQERHALVGNQTFDIVDGTKGNAVHKQVTDIEQPIGCKWLYKRKVNPDGPARYKARLVIKGYEPKEGISYDETYAPVSMMATCNATWNRLDRIDWKRHIDRNSYIDRKCYIDGSDRNGHIDQKCHIDRKRHIDQK